MAIAEPTRAPAAPQSAPAANFDFMTFVDQQIGSTADSVGAIEDFANAIACGLALEVDKHEPVLGDAIARLGYEITERAERIAEMHKAIGNEIYRRRHPDLARAKRSPDLEACKAQPEDDIDAGNGTVEESAGDAMAMSDSSRRSAAKLLDEMISDVKAVGAYAKALNSISLDGDLQDCFSDPIHQLSDDISKRMAAIEERRDRAWRIVANRVAGDVGGASKLARLIEADKAALTALRETSDGEDDEPRAAWTAAVDQEGQTLMAVCSYRCRSLDEVRMRAEYLATLPELKHRLQPEFVEALLRSSAEPATA